jgi:hypothetical protein
MISAPTQGGALSGSGNPLGLRPRVHPHRVCVCAGTPREVMCTLSQGRRGEATHAEWGDGTALGHVTAALETEDMRTVNVMGLRPHACPFHVPRVSRSAYSPVNPMPVQESSTDLHGESRGVLREQSRRRGLSAYHKPKGAQRPRKRARCLSETCSGRVQLSDLRSPPSWGKQRSCVFEYRACSKALEPVPSGLINTHAYAIHSCPHASRCPPPFLEARWGSIPGGRAVIKVS